MQPNITAAIQKKDLLVPELDALESEIKHALCTLGRDTSWRSWTSTDWTRKVKETVGNVITRNGFVWNASGPNNIEWVWDGVAYKVGEGEINGWIIKLRLVMESEWGEKEDVEYDFQKLIVAAKAETRLLVFSARTESAGDEIVDSCKKGIAAFADTCPGARYLFACWLNERADRGSDAFVFKLHVV